MNERLKYIRSLCGDKTQEKFGSRLGVTRNYITQLEMGVKTPSDRFIRDLCRIYNVSESWFRTGEGEPFTPQSRADHIRDFVESALADEPDSVRQRWLYVFSNLSLDDWEVLDRMARAYVLGENEENEG